MSKRAVDTSAETAMSLSREIIVLDFGDEATNPYDFDKPVSRGSGAGNSGNCEYFNQCSNSSINSSAANRLISEVVQSRRRPLLGPSPG